MHATACVAHYLYTGLRSKYHDFDHRCDNQYAVKKCNVINSLTDHYELLGLEITAGEDEIKAAFKRKAKEVHPDVSSEVCCYCCS